MNILLAGGVGYIGSNTTVALMAYRHNVIIADNFSNSSLEALHRVEKITDQSIKLYELDIEDKNELRKVFNENAIDCVIHFAGQKAVCESIEHPLMYYINNIDTTLTLVKMRTKDNTPYIHLINNSDNSSGNTLLLSSRGYRITQ